MKIIIIIIVIILFILYYNNNYTEHAAFVLDGLYLPDDPEKYDIIDIRARYRGILGVKPHLRFDKTGQIERILYAPPKPELGETKCVLFKCPAWISQVACWKCT